MARGLFSLHSRRIVHMDVKSPNVLLTRDYMAKIADVGERLSLGLRPQELILMTSCDVQLENLLRAKT